MSEILPNRVYVNDEGDVLSTYDILPDDHWLNTANGGTAEASHDPDYYKHRAFRDARLARLAGRIARGQSTADLENEPLGCDSGADLPPVFKINPGKIR